MFSAATQAKVVCVSKMATVLKLSINHQTSAEPSFMSSLVEPSQVQRVCV